jgi:hypothetical protein
MSAECGAVSLRDPYAVCGRATGHDGAHIWFGPNAIIAFGSAIATGATDREQR